MPRITGTDLSGTGIYLPILNVELEIPEGTFTGPAVIDSGADMTLIPYEVIEPTQIPFDSLPLAPLPGMGAGGTFEVRELPGRLSWRQYEIASPTVHVAERGRLPFALLGRQDFFEKFTVRFSWHRQPPTVDVDPVT